MSESALQSQSADIRFCRVNSIGALKFTYHSTNNIYMAYGFFTKGFNRSLSDLINTQQTGSDDPMLG